MEPVRLTGSNSFPYLMLDAGHPHYDFWPIHVTFHQGQMKVIIFDLLEGNEVNLYSLVNRWV